MRKTHFYWIFQSAESWWWMIFVTENRDPKRLFSILQCFPTGLAVKSRSRQHLRRLRLEAQSFSPSCVYGRSCFSSFRRHQSVSLGMEGTGVNHQITAFAHSRSCGELLFAAFCDPLLQLICLFWGGVVQLETSSMSGLDKIARTIRQSMWKSHAYFGSRDVPVLIFRLCLLWCFLIIFSMIAVKTNAKCFDGRAVVNEM